MRLEKAHFIVRQELNCETAVCNAYLVDTTSSLNTRMSRNRLFFVLIAFLLLFMQQGAVLHELGHAFEYTRHGQHGEPPGDSPDVCDQCAAYAPGGAALPPSLFDFRAFESASAPPILGALAVVATRPLAAYRSRAPPSRLA
jgi:hypothetical protein